MTIILTLLPYFLIQESIVLNTFLIYLPTLLFVVTILFVLIKYRDDLNVQRNFKLSLLVLAFRNTLVLSSWLTFFNRMISEEGIIPICPLTLIDLFLLPVIYALSEKIKDVMNILFIPIYKLPLSDLYVNILFELPHTGPILMGGLLFTILLLDLYLVYPILFFLFSGMTYYFNAPFFLGAIESPSYEALRQFWLDVHNYLPLPNDPLVLQGTFTLISFTSLQRSYMLHRQFYTTPPQATYLQDAINALDQGIAKAVKPLIKLHTTAYKSYIQHPAAAKFAAGTLLGFTVIGAATGSYRMHQTTQRQLSKDSLEGKKIDSGTEAIRLERDKIQLEMEKLRSERTPLENNLDQNVGGSLDNNPVTTVSPSDGVDSMSFFDLLNDIIESCNYILQLIIG